jgi:hypothetical protein
MSNEAKDQLVDKIDGLIFQVCKMCHSPECREEFAGDEGWTVCPDCRSIEQGYSDAIEKHDLTPQEFEAAEAAGLLDDLVILSGGE